MEQDDGSHHWDRLLLWCQDIFAPFDSENIVIYYSRNISYPWVNHDVKSTRMVMVNLQMIGLRSGLAKTSIKSLARAWVDEWMVDRQVANYPYYLHKYIVLHLLYMQATNYSEINKWANVSKRPFPDTISTQACKELQTYMTKYLLL